MENRVVAEILNNYFGSIFISEDSKDSRVGGTFKQIEIYGKGNLMD